MPTTQPHHSVTSPARGRPEVVRDDFLIFGKPVLGPEEMDEVRAVLESGWLGTGPRVAAFESAFAAYKGVPAEHAVGVSSCTAALHLAFTISGIGAGDEVITTPLTFCATVNAILQAGATPVLADVDPATQNLDPEAVAAAVTPRTAAIVAVHFAGRPCPNDALAAVARRHNLELIEDAAHAIEALAAGRPAGTAGRFGAFSFYATKNITAGEGGMMLCRDAGDADRARRLALHGLSRDAYDRLRGAANGDGSQWRHYQVVEPGFKYNLSDLHAALALRQLQKIERFYGRRVEVWGAYNRALQASGLTLPADTADGDRHALHLYNVRLDNPARRDPFLQAMTRRGIGVGVHYAALPEHPWYRDHLGWRPEQTPVATAIGRTTASLPMTAGLTDAEVARVVDAVTQSLAEV